MDNQVLKEPLLGKNQTQLIELAGELAMPSFRGKQLAQWIYDKRIDSIEEMTNLSKADREKLDSLYTIGRNPPIQRIISVDGTLKYLFQIGEGKSVEAVYIPDKDRATLCISSQVGCKMGCEFCMTGRMGFLANLSTAEILNQIFSIPEFENLTNIVYMGMGEPLDNLESVMASLEVLTSEWGLAWSPKRITLSTIGVLPAMEHFLEQSKVHLAVSMHIATHQERKALMPIEKTQPIEEIVKKLKAHDFGGQRRVSFEYIMFEGLNDSLKQAREIVRLVSGLKCRFNLIRFHSIPDSPLKGSSLRKMEEFRDYLSSKGITTTIRASRGEDILAACGMLSTQAKTNPAT